MHQLYIFRAAIFRLAFFNCFLIEPYLMFSHSANSSFTFGSMWLDSRSSTWICWSREWSNILSKKRPVEASNPKEVALSKHTVHPCRVRNRSCHSRRRSNVYGVFVAFLWRWVPILTKYSDHSCALRTWVYRFKRMKSVSWPRNPEWWGMVPSPIFDRGRVVRLTDARDIC